MILSCHRPHFYCYFLDSNGRRAYLDGFTDSQGNPLLADLREDIIFEKLVRGEEKASITRCAAYLDCIKALENPEPSPQFDVDLGNKPNGKSRVENLKAIGKSARNTIVLEVGVEVIKKMFGVRVKILGG